MRATRRRSTLHLQHFVGALLFFFLTVSPSNGTPALVVDLDTLDVLYSEEPGAAWYPASTTKLMTALVVFETLESGTIALESTVLLSENAMRQKFLNAGLSVGKAMTLDDAMFATIAGSANDVAVAVAETVAGSEGQFVQMMNDAAARLGMTGSHFTNPNGLFDGEQRSTARDLAVLATTIIQKYPQYLHYFGIARVIIDGRPVESYNELLGGFPGTIGMKTGFLCASGRNIVAVAERQGRHVMAILLGATTERERGERSAMLLERAFAGELRPIGGGLHQLANDTASQPMDMRVKLCSDQTASYEQARENLFPMGLPGHASYLGQSVPLKEHRITTWVQPSAKDAPVPPIRPTGR